MSWYAYCLTEQASLSDVRARRMYAIEGMHGIHGAQVFAFPSGDFAMVVSEYSRTEVDARAPWAHAHVVGECFHRGTVFPLRFGTVFETEEGLRQAIRANRRVLMESVQSLRNKSEMHINVTLRELRAHATDVELPAVVGAEYLAKLRQRAVVEREQQTRARAVSTQVSRMFSPLQQEVVCKKAPSGTLTIAIAHLVDNSELARYQARSALAARQLRDCQFAITGPWPPYHFVPGNIRLVSEN